ncbi:MAG: DUF1800 family protein [Bacteroidota bacterium]
MRFLSFIFSLIVTSNVCLGQIEIYEDYVGGGHSDGILVSASSSFSDPDWSDNSSPENTINAEGLDGPRSEAARFLFQASLGASSAEINELASTLDFEQWMDNQIDLPQTNFLNLTREVYTRAHQRHLVVNGNEEEYPYNEVHFQYAWWEAAMTNNDVFRQRVAFALSEIFVISTEGNIRNDGDGIASYYDLLVSNAFGNYRDLIEKITYHPSMAIFLSHYRNQKADTTNNIFPDENFAREILQLFSIGLYDLELDGDHVTDQNGNPIPAYEQADIRNLARVFTGLGAGGITQEGIDEGRITDFSIRANYLDYTTPLAMYDEEHDQDEKYLLGNGPSPSGQSGEEDIDWALDVIFNHPNVGPFISRRLIQQLVKSNPSKNYISEISQVFNNNGDGVRGDLEAVIKAILLHDEARECIWLEEGTNGKLKSPVGRYLQFNKVFADKSVEQQYWTSGFTFQYFTEQLPLASPSVFNFYLPDHQPFGQIVDQGLFAPEFQIHNSATAIGYANEVHNWIRKKEIFSINTLELTTMANYDELIEMADSPEVLINTLDTYLCAGNLDPATRELIKESVENISFVPDYKEFRVEFALFLVMLSPDFTIQK